jgi:predicted membrane protein
MWATKNFKLKVIFFVPLICVLLYAIFPGSGGEGSQRDFRVLDAKTDWWNFITAAIYGFWPDSGLPWIYSLTLSQLGIYSMGIFLLYQKFKAGIYRKLFMISATCGAVFLFQLWRDGSAFAFQTLSLGLISSLTPGEKKTNQIKVIFGVLFGITGCLFKPIFAPIFALIILFMVWDSLSGKKFKLAITFLVLISSILPFAVDKSLSKSFGLVESFPEQQILIYDLSRLYCWGYSPKVTSEAGKALEPLLSKPGELETVCASLSPTGWDGLRVKIPEVSGSPAIRVVEQGNSDELKVLLNGWLRSVSSNPVEWLMVKLSDLSQVLFMASAYQMQGLFISGSESPFQDFADLVLRVFLVPFVILDKLRVFTLAFSIALGLVLLFRNGSNTGGTRTKERVLFQFLLVLSSTAILGSLVFIANNGRYVLPYIFLSYFMALSSLEKSKISS